MMMGIYSIVNNINGKIYIGQSKNIDKRKFQHLNNLRKNKHVNIYLQNAWNKYGEHNFEYNIIEEICDENELDNKEKEYIDFFKSNNMKFGYNLTNGGEGYSLNQEVKDKISFNKRGQGSNLSIDDVGKIKMALYCLIDRKELCDMFNVSPKVITQIAIGKSFGYIYEELNKDIHNIKQRLIDERNSKILQLFNQNYSITEIVNITKYSVSIVEKCIYKYTNSVELKKKKYQDIYEQIIKLYKDGINKYQISKILNISPSIVSRYLKNESNPYKELPFKKITNDIKNEIINLYFNKNMSSIEISKIYNVSDNTIMSYINNYKYANTEVI